MKEKSDILLMMKIISDKASALFSSRAAIPLTATQGHIMAYLRAMEGKGVAQKDIEQHLGVAHSTAKGLLQRLEEKGFVRTAFDSSDRRVKHVYSTEKSRQLKEQIGPLLRKFEEECLVGFSDGELEQLMAMLQRIYANLCGSTAS